MNLSQVADIVFLISSEYGILVGLLKSIELNSYICEVSVSAEIIRVLRKQLSLIGRYIMFAGLFLVHCDEELRLDQATQYFPFFKPEYCACFLLDPRINQTAYCSPFSNLAY